MSDTGTPPRRLLHVDLQTPFGRLQGNLAVPAGEMRLAELAWNAMALDDRLIGMGVASETKQGRAVSCRKGCGACCRQAVPVSPAEAWMLSDLVASLPPQRRAQVLGRFEQAWERLREAGFAGRGLDASSTLADLLSVGLDYFRLGIPCPFLEDEACSIHPQRPSACRRYLVTSPPENCAALGLVPTAPVPQAHNLTEALSRLSATLLGGEPTVIPLTLALAWAEEHREEGARRYDAAALMTGLIELLVSSKAPES
jgi:Fe-S-cluster containining protein